MEKYFNIGSRFPCYGSYAEEADRRSTAAAADGGGSTSEGERPAAAGRNSCHDGG